MLKNDATLLQIKCKNQEETINIMERTVKDLNLEHENEIEQIQKELINNQSLIKHYKGKTIYLVNAKYF